MFFQPDKIVSICYFSFCYPGRQKYLFLKILKTKLFMHNTVDDVALPRNKLFPWSYEKKWRRLALLSVKRGVNQLGKSLAVFVFVLFIFFNSYFFKTTARLKCAQDAMLWSSPCRVYCRYIKEWNDADKRPLASTRKPALVPLNACGSCMVAACGGGKGNLLRSVNKRQWTNHVFSIRPIHHAT